MTDSDEIRRLEGQLADLKARWPSHSVPPAMWDELEMLEEELETAHAAAGTGVSAADGSEDDRDG